MAHMQSTKDRRLSYDVDLWTAFEETFSKPRLKYFFDMATLYDSSLSEPDRKELALQLCQWNVELCESLYVPLQYLEVTLRNKISKALADHCKNDHENDHESEHWHLCERWASDDQIVYSIGEANKEAEAEKKYTDKNIFRNALSEEGRAGQNSVHNVIPALTFGFWVTIFRREPEKTILRDRYSIIFSSQYKKDPKFLRSYAFYKDIYPKLDRILDLRNIIAHHGTIFDLELEQAYEEICYVLEALCDTTCTAMKQRSNFTVVRNSKPEAYILNRIKKSISTKNQNRQQ
jgi:hypothetical protein